MNIKNQSKNNIRKVSKVCINYRVIYVALLFEGIFFVKIKKIFLCTGIIRIYLLQQQKNSTRSRTPVLRKIRISTRGLKTINVRDQT